MSESTPVKSSTTKYILAAIAALIAILGLAYSLLGGTTETVEPVVTEPVVVVEPVVEAPAETTVVVPVSEDNAATAAEITVTAPAATETPVK